MMPRILGVDLPNDRPAYVSLSYLYGIGRRNAVDVCRKVGVDPLLRASQLSDDDIARINTTLEADYVVEGALRRAIQLDIGRLRDIRCYRGMRHRRSLPVRGQRTRTNARTRKGVKKTVAGKKGVKDLKH
jgi:small subunit ribosomal protein S13